MLGRMLIIGDKIPVLQSEFTDDTLLYRATPGGMMDWTMGYFCFHDRPVGLALHLEDAVIREL
jgi:hypothetical protein